MAYVVASLVFSSAPALAVDNNWLVRGRILNVNPNDQSGAVSGIPGSAVGVDSDTTPELDFTYFFSANWGAELILGTSKHDLAGQGSIGPLGRIGSARTLPPTVTAVYQFMPNAGVRPYAGIGVNYTLFYDEKTSASLNAALGPTTAKIDSSWGIAGQLGVDVDITKDWFINLDVKYIRMDTTVRLDSSGTARTVNVDVNPWFFGLGLGTRF
jgi:outer membrane protein